MYTYLLIDDEAITRKGTIKKLEPIQEQIICIGEAENGEDALQKIEQLDPDIIITDMNMPVMDGTRFLPLLNERFPDKQIIVISGYKDFEYMQHAIRANAMDYILKPFGKEDIQAAVLRSIIQLESSSSIRKQLISNVVQKEEAQYDYDIQLLKNIILGYHTSQVTLISKKLSFINHTHHLVLITMHSSDSLDEDDLQKYLTENGFGDLALYLQNDHSPHLGCFILFVPEGSLLDVQNFCKQIVQSLIYRYDQELKNLIFGISSLHADVKELHDAFHETVTALNSKRLSDNFTYYFYQVAADEGIPLNWTKKEEFFFRLESGMEKEISLLLEDLFTYFSISQATLSDIKYYCFQLSNQAQNILSQYMEQVNSDSSSLSMQNILNTMFTLEELQNYYIQFFANIADILKDSSDYATNDSVEKVKIYIQKNYQNNLNMEFISSLLYLNRSYLSHLFKEKAGIKFVDYLNDLRIEKAKELLIETDKKMYSIAKAVGYDNIKYFFRVFKKKTGMTPEQYRNKNE